MGFFSSVWNWFTGSSITSSLAKTALLGYASRLLSGNTAPGSTETAAQPDTGVRLQLDPSTENQIPVLYGEAYFGGNITDAALSADYKKMTYCLTLAEETGEKLSDGFNTGFIFKGVYLNNNRVVFKADGFTVDYTLDPSGNQDISYRDLIKIYFYVNGPLQPQGFSGTTPAAHTVMPGWTSGTHPMTDLIYAIVEVTYNKDKNVTGLPDCVFHVDTNMKKPGDVLVDYMINTRYGAGIPVTSLDASFIDLNTYAATGFTYTNKIGQSATSAITINGLIDTTQPVLDNMKQLADAANAWISYDTTTGKWVVVVNKAGSSIASFTDSNIIGDISISGTSLTQLNSAADVKYQNTDILDKTDFVKISIPSGDLYANEPGKVIEIALPFTNSQVVAAKIGLVQLKQGRIDKIIKFKSDFSYINLTAGDLIDVTTSTYGFTNKVFRIITIAESFDEEGVLSMDITALEYDSAVYDYNITEFDVETDGGILGIGSIGKPNTPTVTKTEEAATPRIVINGLVPSGIVDAVEFWITFDTGVSESNRNYIKIGQFTSTTGVSLTEDDAVSYTYTGLSQSDFFVKIRGINSITSGPYSDPTGLIEYVPIVVADTVSDTPVGIGGQLMSLGLLTLLNNLDGIYKGLFGAGSLVDKIIDGIQDATGVDLKAGGPGVPGADGVDGKDAPPCLLSFGTNQYPLDRSTGENPETPYPNEVALGPNDPTKVTLSGTVADHADPTGNYYFSFSDDTTLSIGEGNVKLYKSDGTLVQTIAAASLEIDNVNRIINIPFSTRNNKTDYYILMDQGVIKGSNGCLSPGRLSSANWNFHTDTPSPRPVLKPTPIAEPSRPCPPLKFVKLITKTYQDKIAVNNLSTDIETNLRLEFNQTIVLQNSGTIVITYSGGNHQTFDLSKTFSNDKVSEELVSVQGNTLYVNPTVDLTKGTTYCITVSAGCVKDTCGASNTAITGCTATWTTDGGPTAVVSVPSTSGNSINEVGVTANYDRKVVPSSGTIEILNSSNVVIKTIPSNSPAVTIKEG